MTNKMTTSCCILVLLCMLSTLLHPVSAQLPPQGCADDNKNAQARFGTSCPNIAQDGLCSASPYVEQNVTTYCPVSCGVCQPNGTGHCTGLDDSLFMIDTDGLSCSQIANLGLCTSFQPETDVIMRCPIACGLCQPPPSIDCLPDSTTSYVLDHYGLTCGELQQLGMCASYAQNEASARLAEVMRLYCPATCKSCQTYYANVTCTSFDNNTIAQEIYGMTCAQLAKGQFCHYTVPGTGNPGSNFMINFMRDNCPQSCGYCRPANPPVPINKCADAFDYFTNFSFSCAQEPTSRCTNASFASECAGTCNRCAPLQPSITGCGDDDVYVLLHGLPGCKKSAELGYCNSSSAVDLNSGLMVSMVKTHCALSCELCQTTPQPTTVQGTTVGPCHNDDSWMLAQGFLSCADMAKGGYCHFTPHGPGDEFMLNTMAQQCPQACGFCECSDDNGLTMQLFNQTCTQAAAAGRCGVSATVNESLAFQIKTSCPLACLQCSAANNVLTTTVGPVVTTQPSVQSGASKFGNGEIAAVVLAVAVLVLVVSLFAVYRRKTIDKKNAQRPLLNNSRADLTELNQVQTSNVDALNQPVYYSDASRGTVNNPLYSNSPATRRRSITLRSGLSADSDTDNDDHTHDSSLYPLAEGSDPAGTYVLATSTTSPTYAIASGPAYLEPMKPLTNNWTSSASPSATSTLKSEPDYAIATHNEYAMPHSIPLPSGSSSPQHPSPNRKTTTTSVTTPGAKSGSMALQARPTTVYELPVASAFRIPGKKEDELYDALESKGQRIQGKQLQLAPVVLGTGSFGEVSKGTLARPNKSQVDVAVKVLKNTSSTNRIKLLQEAAIMGQFNHDNICKLYGVVNTNSENTDTTKSPRRSPPKLATDANDSKTDADEPIMLVLELLPNGSLYEYLREMNSRGVKLEHATLFKMALDIANAMKYLHSMSFIHRDLATRNCLIGENMQIKLSDFGLARDVLDDDYYRATGGSIPLRWTAPEAIFYKKYSPASDVWSFGITMYEMWTGASRPYGKWTNQKILAELERGYRLPLPSGCSTSAYAIMLSCWHPDPEQRPTFTQLCMQLSNFLNDYQTRPIVDEEQEIQRLATLQRSFVRATAAASAQAKVERAYDTIGGSAESASYGFGSSSYTNPGIDIDTSRCSVSAELFLASRQPSPVQSPSATLSRSALSVTAKKVSFYQPLTLPADIEEEPSDVIVPVGVWNPYTSLAANQYEELALHQLDGDSNVSIPIVGVWNRFHGEADTDADYSNAGRVLVNDDVGAGSKVTEGEYMEVTDLM